MAYSTDPSASSCGLFIQQEKFAAVSYERESVRLCQHYSILNCLGLLFSKSVMEMKIKIKYHFPNSQSFELLEIYNSLEESLKELNYRDSAPPPGGQSDMTLCC